MNEAHAILDRLKIGGKRPEFETDETGIFYTREAMESARNMVEAEIQLLKAEIRNRREQLHTLNKELDR